MNQGMERRWKAIGLLLLLSTAVTLAPPVVWANGDHVADHEPRRETLHVEGMVCPLCERTVQSILQNLDGVLEASADRFSETARVTYDPSRITPERMVQAINSQTYYRTSVASGTPSASRRPDEGTATDGPIYTAVIRVEGMHDEKTASWATQALAIEGIVDGSVNLEEATLTIQYDPRQMTAEQIVDALTQSLRFGVSLVSVRKPGGGGLVSVVIGMTIAVILAVVTWPLLRRTPLLERVPLGFLGRGRSRGKPSRSRKRRKGKRRRKG